MKKRARAILIAVLFFLTITAAHAEINLQGPAKTTVSLGDEIQLTGYVLQQTAMFGLLKFDLACNQRQAILVKSISLKAGVQNTFDEAIPMNQHFQGPCYIETILEVNGQEVESAQSSQFTLTTELLGDIQVDKTTVQLGEDINIEGTITLPDGTKITGSAKITFKKEGTIYLQEVVPVQKGKFSYNYDTKDNPAGTYEVEIDISDAYQNQQLFIVPGFTILGDITLTANTQQATYLPEEKIKLSGTAASGATKVKDGTVTITFNNQAYETTITRGKFKVTLDIPKNIKSGKHTITFVAEDTYGNRIEGATQIEITPVPTAITLVTNTDQLRPLQQLTIKPTLLDQAGDIIATDLTIIIKDADKDKVFEETIPSNEQTALTLPASSVPGSWMITVTDLGVTAEKAITVDKLGTIAFAINGEILSITNTGNIFLKQTLTILATSPAQSREITKKIKLDPGETTTVDLAKGTEVGTYTVSINEQTFEGVTIAKKKLNINLPWKPILITLVIFLLIWFILLKAKNLPKKRYKSKHRRQKRHHKRRRLSDRHHVQKYHADMQERVTKRRGPMRFPIKKKQDDYIMELPKKKVRSQVTASEPDPLDYKRNEDVYPSYGESNEEETNVDPFKGKEDPPKKKGLFNMFD